MVHQGYPALPLATRQTPQLKIGFADVYPRAAWLAQTESKCLSIPYTLDILLEYKSCDMFGLGIFEAFPGSQSPPAPIKAHSTIDAADFIYIGHLLHSVAGNLVSPTSDASYCASALGTSEGTA